MLRKAKNTKDNYQTIKWDEEKGLEVFLQRTGNGIIKGTLFTVLQCCLESATEMLDAKQKL